MNLELVRKYLVVGRVDLEYVPSVFPGNHKSPRSTIKKSAIGYIYTHEMSMMLNPNIENTNLPAVATFGKGRPGMIKIGWQTADFINFKHMKIIECPRDAMQGITRFIPTDLKIRYINSLLDVGFDTIDFGSFVSPKAIPQMKDTKEVLEGLNVSSTKSKLLVIVANVRGAETASDYDEITYMGYPLSLSETFQQRNTNRSIDTAFDNLAEIQEICQMEDKTLVVYLSMGFGNPYGDPYSVDLVGEFVQRLDKMEVGIISLADTIGVSKPEIIGGLFQALIPKFPHIEFGAHLHSTPDTSHEKVEAAYNSGCRRIDAAIRGFGGCPMAKDDLVGNLATEGLIRSLNRLEVNFSYNKEAFEKSMLLSNEVFL